MNETGVEHRVVKQTTVGPTCVSTIYMCIDQKIADAYMKKNTPEVYDMIKEFRDTLKRIFQGDTEGEEWKNADAPEQESLVEEDAPWHIMGPYYETMVFGECPFAEHKQRRQTEEEALRDHQEMVDNVRSFLG